MEHVSSKSCYTRSRTANKTQEKQKKETRAHFLAFLEDIDIEVFFQYIFVLFLRTIETILTKPGTKHHLVKLWRGFKFVHMKDQAFFPVKYPVSWGKNWQNVRIFSMQLHWVNFNQTRRRSSLGGEASDLFKLKVTPFSMGRYYSKNT